MAVGEAAGSTVEFGSSASAGVIYDDIVVIVEVSVDKARNSCTTVGE